jgi:elongation factor Ts
LVRASVQAAIPKEREEMAVADITASMVKALREETGAGMMECKKVLGETGGDHDAAVKLLRERGAAKASKLGGRETTEGSIGSYVHGGKIGVLVEVGCNTDFVARNEDFQEFCQDLAMHIAAQAPRWLRREDVPADVVAAEKEIYVAQAADKPEQVRDKIADGKLDKWYSEVCLLEQQWVRGKEKLGKDVTIEELRANLSSTTGENVEIRRFVRYQLGE